MRQACRRRFILLYALAFTVFASSHAQAQSRTYRVATLFGTPGAEASRLTNPLIEKLSEAGYQEGRNLHLDQRWAEGRLERLPALAAELTALNPDVIFVVGTQAALAAATATSTIPIVFILVSDPVASGLAKSLRRPGGNLTGLSAQISDIQAKRLQLLKEVLPSASRVAVLHDAHNSAELTLISLLKKAGGALNIDLRVVEASAAEAFASAFRVLEQERPDALFVFESPLNFSQRGRIVDFAQRQRLVAIYGERAFVEAGGLMSYSMSWTEHARAAATYIDKILKGASPSEMPVEQPTRFEFVLSLRTAKALGLKIPQSVLLRADRVIE